jgi:hypothetical protein
MNAAATHRAPLGSAYVLGREPLAVAMPTPEPTPQPPARVHEGPAVSADLYRSLAEVKGQAQFLLYLADQIEDSLEQLGDEKEDCQGSFLCKVLGMYSAQLESKHQGLGDKIAETCQEVYVTVREFDVSA